MKKIKKQFSCLEVLNIVGFINQFTADPDKMDYLPLKFKWDLSKNMKKLTPIAREYEEFRDKEINSLRSKYFDIEHSDEIMQPKIGADGEPEIDEDGNQVTEPARQVKEEFMDEYKDVVNQLNNKLNEIVMELNTVELNCVDLDAFVESLPDDTKIDFQDLNMLSFMDETTSVLTEDSIEEVM